MTCHCHHHHHYHSLIRRGHRSFNQQSTTSSLLVTSVFISIQILAYSSPTASGLRISGKPCYGYRDGSEVPGTCMFSWECIRQDGIRLGTCAEGFLFGVCCSIKEHTTNISADHTTSDIDNNKIPQSGNLLTESATVISSSHSKTTLPSISSTTLSSSPVPVTTTSSSSTATTSGSRLAGGESVESEILVTTSPSSSSSSSLTPSRLSQSPISEVDYVTSSSSTVVNESLPSSSSSSHLPLKKPSSPPPILVFKVSTPPPEVVVTSRPQVHFPSSSTSSTTTRRAIITTATTQTLKTRKPVVHVVRTTTTRKPVSVRPVYHKTTTVKPAAPSSSKPARPIGTNFYPQSPSHSSSSSPSSLSPSSTTTVKSSTSLTPTTTTTSAPPIFLTTRTTTVSSTAVTSSSPSSLENSGSSTTSPSLSSSSTTLPITTSSTTNSSRLQTVQEVCGRRRITPKKTARIVGGAQSKFSEWPWMVSLRQWKKNAFLHKCGAALLNNYWAITAAHCVENVAPNDLLLRLGEYDVSNENEPYPYIERRVQIIAPHPEFDPRTFEYDLALLRFYEPVHYRPNIVPICIPEGNDTFVGQFATVTGWGRLYEDGPLPDTLQHVEVPVITNKDCESMYRRAGYIEEIPNIFICAGLSKGAKDSCEGDSGGPLVLNRDGRWDLIGIISWGIGCALPNQPGVYTRITEFSSWINQIIAF